MSTFIVFVAFCLFISTIEGLSVECPSNEYRDSCGVRCESTCETALIRVRPCLAICDPPACHCNNGYHRHSNGTCVTIRECPTKEFKCQQNEEVNSCGDLCEKKCDNLNPICVEICNPPACVCKDGFARHHYGSCTAVTNGHCSDN